MTYLLLYPPIGHAEQHEQCAKRSEGTFYASAKDPESVYKDCTNHYLLGRIVTKRTNEPEVSCVR